MNPWNEIEGAALPLGATWIEEKEVVNFSLYSEESTGLKLLIFAQDQYNQAVASFDFDPIVNRTGRVWHMLIPKSALNGGYYYAYRVSGSHNPAQGLRFDQQKLILDPYAKAVLFPPDYSRAACALPGDTMGKAPIGYFSTSVDDYDWSGDVSPTLHKHDLVIYELHVRGFTRDPSSDVATASRGTYQGIIEKIPYLQSLGVTAIELMPVHQFDPQENNYWGYMTLNFFAPHNEYATQPEVCSQRNEFRDMVKALHQADIEVILDVVYNHTSEVDEKGPTYCYRGLDNNTYYLLESDQRYYRNDAGTGNVINTSNRFVRHLIIDSLRYWVKEMHVDGFRFDLASIFTRNADGSINLVNPPIIGEITTDPLFRKVRLIAEAWDMASYQLGQSFPGITWMQWNGRFRDDLRRWVKSDQGLIAETMKRIYGSNDLFPDDLPNVYHAYQSVNFVSAHDGFSLYDLVSFNQKHNEANGHNNTDGTDDNNSWNCGWEGHTDLPPQVAELRRRQIRNLITLMMLSNGTPMFVMGDEFLNTQDGNNNPYNQDNPTTWLDWNLTRENQDMLRFFRKIIAFRKSHPAIGRSRYWRNDVSWFGAGENLEFDFNSHTLAYCIHGASSQDVDIYVMCNSYWEGLEFDIQIGMANEWNILVDTGKPSPNDIFDESNAVSISSLKYRVEARSTVVLSRDTGS